MVFAIAMIGAIVAWAITSSNSNELKNSDKVKGLAFLGVLVAVIGSPAFIVIDIIFVVIGAILGAFGLFSNDKD